MAKEKTKTLGTFWAIAPAGLGIVLLVTMMWGVVQHIQKVQTDKPSVVCFADTITIPSTYKVRHLWSSDGENSYDEVLTQTDKGVLRCRGKSYSYLFDTGYVIWEK